MNNKIFAILLTLVSFPVLAQRVSVSKISESRSTEDSYFGNRTEIGITVSGDEVRRHKFVRISQITKAVDDQDFDLIGEKNSTEYAAIEGNAATLTLNLQNASRKAETIKEITGTLSLFAPTEANGGIIKVKNMGTQTNKDLVPKDKDLDIVYLTKESYEKFTQDEKNKREAELKKQPKEMQELAKGLMGLIDAFSFTDWSYPQVNLMIKGDPEKIVSLSVQKPTGEELSSNGSSSTTNLKTYFFSEEVKPNYTLVITVEVAGAIKSIPLNLKNVELP